MKTTETQTDAPQLFCPNEECSARGKIGAGNLMSHGKKRERYKCKTCGKTFSAHRGTMFEGLRKEEQLIIEVVTLLSYGCPRQAIVHAFGLDERTVARWQERAGQHCHKVHEATVMQARLNLEHVQADEIRVKGHRLIPWMAMAIMVSTRLWLGGAVSEHRDRQLADQLLAMVKACCLPLCALLVLTDGWSAYPGSIRRAFREKMKRANPRGRCRLQAWPEIVIVLKVNKNLHQMAIKLTEKRLSEQTVKKAEQEMPITSEHGVDYGTGTAAAVVSEEV